MTPSAKRLEPLAVDAANGVGAIKLAYMRQTLARFLQIEIFNDGRKGHLNEKVNSMKILTIQNTSFLIQFSVVLIMSNCIRKHRMVYL
jgi:hypothetical protein